MSVTVSVLIPNWNGGDIIEECLNSILRHTRVEEFEIIVVDNASNDGSQLKIENLARREPRIRTKFNSENLFFARACNQAYAMSRGRFVLVANNDVIVKDDAISALVAHAERHPEAGVVTPLLCDREGRPQEFCRRLPNALFVIARYHLLGRGIDRFVLRRSIHNRYFYRDRAFRTTEVIEQPGASFSLYRRDIIEKLGLLFDETFPLLFNDVDLSRRVRDLGAQSHVVPTINVIHLGGISSAKLRSAAYNQMQYRGLFTYFRRYHPLQYAFLACVWPRRWHSWRRSRDSATGSAQSQSPAPSNDRS